MTDTKHTKEPWVADVEALGLWIVGSKGQTITEISGECTENKDIENRARIIACVNAMQGIDDPEAFMRDVVEHLDKALVRGPNYYAVTQHLKGGDE